MFFFSLFFVLKKWTEYRSKNENFIIIHKVAKHRAPSSLSDLFLEKQMKSNVDGCPENIFFSPLSDQRHGYKRLFSVNWVSKERKDYSYYFHYCLCNAAPLLSDDYMKHGNGNWVSEKCGARGVSSRHTKSLRLYRFYPVGCLKSHISGRWHSGEETSGTDS